MEELDFGGTHSDGLQCPLFELLLSTNYFSPVGEGAAGVDKEAFDAHCPSGASRHLLLERDSWQTKTLVKVSLFPVVFNTQYFPQLLIWKKARQCAPPARLQHRTGR